METLPSPVIIAHRGYNRFYPENTLVSFQAAMQSGAHMIELDTTLSRDRKPVVIHDDTLDRTTNGTGRVCDTDLADIKRLDAGSWFAPRFQGETVPTLAEVLDRFGNRIWINIEIKESAFEAADLADGIETQVVSLIRSRKCGRMVLVSSFYPQILQRIASLDKTLALGFLTEAQDSETVLQLANNLRPFSWNPDVESVTEEMVTSMHEHNIRVFPYTVNAVSQAKEMLKMKVDGLFTDDPAMMIKYCSGQKQQQTVQ